MIPPSVTEGKRIPKDGSDCYIILEILSCCEPVHVLEIFDSAPGLRNWAVRSRISNLRSMGYKIINLRDSRQNTENIAISPKFAIKYGRTDKEAIYLLIAQPSASCAPGGASEMAIPAVFDQDGQKSLF